MIHHLLVRSTDTRHPNGCVPKNCRAGTLAIGIFVFLCHQKCMLAFLQPNSPRFERLARPHALSPRFIQTRSIARRKSALLSSGSNNDDDPDADPGARVPLPHLTANDLDARRRQLITCMLAVAASSFMAVDVSPGLPPVVNAAELAQRLDDFVDIIKPPLDNRSYVTYTLPNGLRVLLCSDPSSSNEAAAAMDVHVGACSDPDYLPGLAHFTEHMLFLGTEKYKQEDSFGKYLSLNGGSSNAYTDSENTVYYFTMNTEADNKLAEGLSRFGSFFSGPLFTESATAREVNAIESENAKNMQSDLFRNFQISKARANSNHPFSKFFTGNKETLIDGPKGTGVNLRNELIRFYNKFYSANQMTLAVVAPQSLPVLKQMVNEAFSDIPNRAADKPEKAWVGVAPFSNGDSIIPSFRHVVKIVPVSDLRQLQVSWPIVYQSDDERVSALLVKPSEYIAHLLGHEGPRSLLSYLKRKGWANSLGCSNVEELSDFETFDVVVGLTPQGLEAADSVIETIFSFIRLLREQPIPDYIFQEILQLEELKWRFYTKGSPGGYATSLSTAMQKYPPELYVAGPLRLALDNFAISPLLSSLPRSSFSSAQQLARTRDLVNAYVREMTVDNSMVTILSKTFEDKTDAMERWYGTKYLARPVQPPTLEKWRQCPSSRSLKIDFPLPNQFIPSEAGLRVKYPQDGSEYRKKSFEELMVPLTPPRIIRDDGIDGRWTVYFKEDRRFGKPKGYIVFQILTKEVFAAPMNAALANLYELCVSDRLQEYAYDAELAGMVYEVKVLPRGVRLTFGGYNEKLKDFASFISRKLSFDSKYLLPRDDKGFAIYKDQIMRALSAFDVSQPYSHASYYSQITLQPQRFQYTNKELRDATRKATLPDLVSYVNTLWTSGKGECLIQGNYDEAQALELVKRIGDVIPFKSISEVEYPPRLKALPLPVSAYLSRPPILKIAEPNPQNENSVSYVMLQSLGKSEKDHVLMEILSAIVEQPFYDELRTKRQLGYIVASGVKGIANTRTLSFIVQSSVAPSDALTIEIIKFLDSTEKSLLHKLSNADLAVYVKSLIEKKTEPDKDLVVEVTRNWSEISSGRLQFDRLQREAAALLEVDKEDILTFWRTIYASNDRRVLVTEMIPREGKASSLPPPTTTGYGSKDDTAEKVILGIDDIDLFRRVRERIVYDQATLAIE